MKFNLTTQAADAIKTDCLIVPLVDGTVLSNVAKRIDVKANNIISNTKGDIATELGQYRLLPLPQNLPAKRLLLIHIGEHRPLSLTAFKQLTHTIWQVLKATPCQNSVFILDQIRIEKLDKDGLLQQAILHLNTAAYSFSTYKSKQDEIALQEITFTTKKTLQRQQQNILESTRALLSGINFAKDLANTPSNIATPGYLVEQAKQLGNQQQKLHLQVLNEAELKRLKMHALLAVGQGSRQASHLIELQYFGGKRHELPTVLIGKGVTFDSGGISLKPAAGMQDLKYDMAGGATVFGVMRAIAEQGLPINVIGLVPTVENMPGGNSYRPGDIITSMSGQTIEVINTDAEGRLILCDAISYAKKFKPRVIIDIATLTGAIMIALGSVHSGLFTPDDQLAKALQRAADKSGDTIWRMPLDMNYQKLMDSKIADMQNCGPRFAGSITAACFLQRFISQEQAWAHLDVAGTTHERNNSLGATGRPVPLLVEYLQQQCINTNATG